MEPTRPVLGSPYAFPDSPGDYHSLHSHCDYVLREALRFRSAFAAGLPEYGARAFVQYSPATDVGVQYVREDAPKPAPGEDARWERGLGGPRAVAAHASVDAAGTVDVVCDRRWSDRLATRGFLVAGSGGAAGGAVVRADGPWWTAAARASSDKALLGASGAARLGENTTVGGEAYYSAEANDYTGSAGVRHRFGGAGGPALSGTCNAYGRAVVSYSVPFTPRLRVASQLVYELGTMLSSIRLGVDLALPWGVSGHATEVAVAADPDRGGTVVVSHRWPRGWYAAVAARTHWGSGGGGGGGGTGASVGVSACF